VSKYKELADALRKGCEIRPRKCIGYFTLKTQYACAVGAMAVAKDVDPFNFFPSEFDDYVVHPEIPKTTEPLYTVITELNDDFNWSREKIADWMETL
jgi:hypothetical protein